MPGVSLFLKVMIINSVQPSPLDFYMANADHSLYVQENENGIVIIYIYVDELIVGGDNDAKIVHVKNLLKQDFFMTNLGGHSSAFPHSVATHKSVTTVRRTMGRAGDWKGQPGNIYTGA